MTSKYVLWRFNSLSQGWTRFTEVAPFDAEYYNQQTVMVACLGKIFFNLTQDPYSSFPMGIFNPDAAASVKNNKQIAYIDPVTGQLSWRSGASEIGHYDPKTGQWIPPPPPPPPVYHRGGGGGGHGGGGGTAPS